MKMKIDVALAARSDFSLGESLMKVADIVSRAKELGYQTVAITDTMTISGLLIGDTRFVQKVALEALADASRRGSALASWTGGTFGGLIVITSVLEMVGYSYALAKNGADAPEST